MKINVLLIVIIPILTSCYSVNNEYESNAQVHKLTSKEKLFIENLKADDFRDVNLNVPIVGHGELGKSNYTVNATPHFKLNFNNADSIIEVRKKLYIELYSKVIEDSIIYDCSLYSIKLEYGVDNMNEYNLYPNLTSSVSKEMLEKWCGFKVVKIGKDKYKRVKI